MYKLFALVSMLALGLPLGAAEEKVNVEKRARAIASYLDEQALVVVRVDMTRIDAEALASTFGDLAQVEGKELTQGKQVLKQWVADFTKAGGKDLYVVFSLADLPQGPPFVIIPGADVGANFDSEAIVKLLHSAKGTPQDRTHSAPFSSEVAEQIDSVVFAGSKAARQRLRTLKPMARPELTAAFSAAGDTALQLLLLPTADTRRAITETMPNLPLMFGGTPTSVFTQGISWAAVGANAPPKMSLELVIQSKDAKSAQALQKWFASTLRILSGIEELKRVVPDFAKLAGPLTPKVNEDRLTLSLTQENWTAVLKPVLVKIRATNLRAVSTNNLKQIGLAMHNYHDAHKAFPAVANSSKTGKPLLSWRVHLLPYLDQDKLYREFHLDEPWDSEHNKKLISRMPAIYQSSRKLAGTGKTTYLGVHGKGAMFEGLKPVEIKEVTDGTSNTIFMVDAVEDRAVIWTKPADLEVDFEKPSAGLIGHAEKTFAVLFVDGSVRTIRESVDPKVLKALFTRNGGEVIPGNF